MGHLAENLPMENDGCRIRKPASYPTRSMLTTGLRAEI